MNHGSPLSKDWKIKKEPELKKFPKPKFNISLGTTKRILKKSESTIGENAMRWLNSYMENKIQGESLPRAFLSNDLPSQLVTTYGTDGAERWIDKIVEDFKRQCGLSIPNEHPSVSG